MATPSSSSSSPSPSSSVRPDGSRPLTLDEVERTFGALFIGFAIATILYGFTVFQAYVYLSRYPKDSFWTKGTVISLWLLDTAIATLISQALYYYLIEEFLSPLGLVHATLTFCAENGLAVIVTFIVQLFLAIRLWKISNRTWILPIVIAFNAVVALAFGVAMTVQIFRSRRLADFAHAPMEVTAALSQGFAALADVVAVGALCWRLPARPARGSNANGYSPGQGGGGGSVGLVGEGGVEVEVRIGVGVGREMGVGVEKLPAAPGWFDRLTLALVDRAAGVAIMQIAYFCVFLAMPSKLIWIPFHLVASKVYVNTLLAIPPTKHPSLASGCFGTCDCGCRSSGGSRASGCACACCRADADDGVGGLDLARELEVELELPVRRAARKASEGASASGSGSGSVSECVEEGQEVERDVHPTRTSAELGAAAEQLGKEDTRRRSRGPWVTGYGYWDNGGDCSNGSVSC